MNIIIGLGNPDKKYELTRHNAGFMFLDFLIKELNLEWEVDKKSKSLIAKNNNFFLIKPMDYMNNSGQTIKNCLDYYKLIKTNYSSNDLIDNFFVVHDEIDLPLGDYKFSKNSSSAGHKGVQSIINIFNTKNFARIRLGIKSLEENLIPTEKFVLEKFNKEELEIINKVIEKAKKNLLEKINIE
jgi:PTH1 family peptidyl-tRNA hydrolase